MADMQAASRAGQASAVGRPRRRSSPSPLTATLVTIVCAFVAACQSTGSDTANRGKTSQVVPDVPITQGRYLVGEPYKENGVWYRPIEDWTYNEVGRASWYGPGYHGKRTANGETFDLRALTAAHPTLPLPSRVRVTNIENGKSIVVRVNDRGPFEKGRLIDVSQRAAEMLGFKDKGTARVRVQMLGRAPLEMFRMAAPKGDQPDLPVRAAPSAEVNAAVLPPPSAASPAGENDDEARGRDDGGETRVASAEEKDDPSAKSQGDPVGDLIDRMTVEEEPEDGEKDPAGGSQKDETRIAGTNGNSADSAGSSVTGRFFIQAGAFTVPENAYSLRRLIIKAITGATVSVNPAQVGNREFFRVRVGPFSSSEEASGILAQVRNLGQNEARIIRD